MLILVTHKIAKEQLGKGEAVPAKLDTIPTDVLAIGEIFAGRETADAGVQAIAKRIRPVKGGYSVGHKDITAGTIATCVYDILQPGPFDGGVNPADRIATLTRFVPINFAPGSSNLVDAAIAEALFDDLDREIHWSGPARGWRQKAGVTVGMIVKKTGRTTNFTTGRITAINATINVNYGGGRVGRFVDQIVTTNMSAGGDSGSLVTTLDNVAVGLLYAGSSVAMIANQIENVRALLRVEVAEAIL